MQAMFFLIKVVQIFRYYGLKYLYNKVYYYLLHIVILHLIQIDLEQHTTHIISHQSVLISHFL